jgi:hypothetical protein
MRSIVFLPKLYLSIIRKATKKVGNSATIVKKISNKPWFSAVNIKGIKNNIPEPIKVANIDFAHNLQVIGKLAS